MSGGEVDKPLEELPQRLQVALLLEALESDPSEVDRMLEARARRDDIARPHSRWGHGSGWEPDLEEPTRRRERGR
ncbi:hypothetical protein ACFXGA_27115 [Actinosynnema sp. NPDC059335]|uniref:hypothetical protein n=1 Tax=Actinosynnema sp. NPDC059335 TaxID=3346804 RepID=UPI00366FCEBB